MHDSLVIIVSVAPPDRVEVEDYLKQGYRVFWKTHNEQHEIHWGNVGRLTE